MMTEPTDDAKVIHRASLDKATPIERTAFLKDACAGNPDLLQRVNDLLAAHEESNRPQHALTRSVGPTVTAAPVSHSSDAVIGFYKLLQQIGEGGIGVVYMAEQDQPVHRRVALKIVKPGMDSASHRPLRGGAAGAGHHGSPKYRQSLRWRHDRPTAGPYFVMELVHGARITKYCDEHRLTLRQRLELFVPVCKAVQHAHQKGIIHRDLKPTNILVASTTVNR